MTRGEVVNFAAVLDNKSAIWLYIMNSSQYSVFTRCAPKCIQPLLGGHGSYYQQAGQTKPDYFLNTSLSIAKSYGENFTAPTSGTFYFVFDNSLGGTSTNYQFQNATGFEVGSIRMTVFAVATSYSPNWELALVGIAQILVGGVTATVLGFQPRITKARRDRSFIRRFGTILIVLAILGTMAIDLPIFYSVATSSPDALLPSLRSGHPLNSTAQQPPPSNYSIFEIDSDYLSNVGSAGYGEMSVDTIDQLAFVPAPQNSSIYIYDLPNEAESDIAGFNYPQASLYIPEINGGELYVSNGGNGTVDVMAVNDSSYPIILQKIAEIDLSSPDYLAYDNSSGLVYVGYGDGNSSGLAIINATSNALVGKVPLESTPGQIAVEQNGTRIFVSLPDSIAVIDKTTRTVVESFPDGGALGLDESDNELFVGTANPSQFLVLDDQSGGVLSSLPLPSIPGVISFDPISKLAMATCSNGTLEVFQQYQNDSGSYFHLASEPTGPQASSSVFYPGQELVLVAIPQYPYQLAQLMTFGIYSV